MNTETKTETTEKKMRVPLPVKNCKKCHGTGRIGFVSKLQPNQLVKARDGKNTHEEGDAILCKCVLSGKNYFEVPMPVMPKAEPQTGETGTQG